jgi:hypothetical protein
MILSNYDQWKLRSPDDEYWYLQPEEDEEEEPEYFPLELEDLDEMNLWEIVEE